MVAKGMIEKSTMTGAVLEKAWHSSEDLSELADRGFMDSFIYPGLDLHAILNYSYTAAATAFRRQTRLKSFVACML